MINSTNYYIFHHYFNYPLTLKLSIDNITISFFKSYYNSVSSFLNGNEDTYNTCDDNDVIIENDMKESKSEGWLKGIYSGAYNQSGELWKAVKTDLTEFASVISKDAKIALVKTASGVKSGLVGSEENLSPDSGESLDENSKSSTSKIRSGINRLLDQVSKALYIPPELDDEDYYYRNEDDCQTIYNRIDTRIADLQRNRTTFDTDPGADETDPDLGDFSKWRDNLNLDDFQPKIAELVKTNQNLFDNYAELVPRYLTHDEFWSRYFYRVASINCEESRREALKLKISHNEDVAATDPDPCDWDDGNDTYEESNLLTKIDADNKGADDSEEHVIKDKGQMKSANQTSSTKDEILFDDRSLKFKETDDIVLVKHSIESSSASEDNFVDANSSIDPKVVNDDIGWDIDIDVDVNEEDIELAKKLSEADALEKKWDEWS